MGVIWNGQHQAPGRVRGGELASPRFDDRSRATQDHNDRRLQQFRDLNPFASMFESLIDRFGPNPGGGRDDEEEDDGW